MSLDIIKKVFQNLGSGSNWSLQLLNIKTSKRTGTGCSSRQITLSPNGRLSTLINDIAAVYTGTGKKQSIRIEKFASMTGLQMRLLFISFLLPMN